MLRISYTHMHGAELLWDWEAGPLEIIFGWSIASELTQKVLLLQYSKLLTTY